MRQNTCQRLLYTGTMLATLRRRYWRWFYDRAAGLYDGVLALGERLGVGSESRLRGELLASLNSQAGTLLDVGCGTAAARPQVPAGIDYVGVDLSRGMLSRAQAKCAALQLPADFVQADAAALPFRTSSFQAAFAMGVLQHTHKPQQVVSELRRTANERGHIIIADELRARGRLMANLGEKHETSRRGEYFVLFLKPL